MISKAQKFEAAKLAPLGSHVLPDDGEVIERPDWYQILSPSAKTSSMNEVVFSTFGLSDMEREVERVIAQYQAHGLSFKWCVGPWTKPPELGQYLKGLGFHYWQARGMVIETGRFHTTVPSDVEVEALNSSNIDDYIETFAKGWSGSFPALGKNELKKRFLSKFPDEGPREFFLARIGRTPVGTASFFKNKHTNSIYLTGGNVLPEFQFRGIYKALLKTRIDRAADLGIGLVTTHAREATSAPILERLRFETAFDYTVYERLAN